MEFTIKTLEKKAEKGMLNEFEYGYLRALYKSKDLAEKLIKKSNWSDEPTVKKFIKLIKG